jgi:predicted RND superfamily exporter protein
MDWFANIIIEKRKTIIILFLILMLICGILLLFVDVNYNLVDYLPKNAQSTVALEIMKKEFAESIPNAGVMIKDVSLMEAMEYKQKLASIDGVDQVIWLDDMMDIKEPLSMGDPDTIEGFYKNGNALFSVTIARGMEKDASEAIWQLIGEENAQLQPGGLPAEKCPVHCGT